MPNRRLADSRLRRLPEIWEPGSEAMATVFSEIPVAIGAPGVHLYWRILANWPEWLAMAWPSLAGACNSTSLRSAAVTIREAAFIHEAVGLPSHKAFRGDLARAEIDAELREKIENFNAVSQTALSRLLVAAALARRMAHRRQFELSPELERVAGGESPGAVYVPPLRDSEARGKAVDVLARIGVEHALPFVDDYLRSLARIPDYLSAAWNAIRPLVGDPEYHARAESLGALAADAAARLIAPDGDVRQRGSPGPAPRPALAVLDAFADFMLPQALIDVTLIRALTSGPDHAVD
jgi:hypothetical protein